MEKFTKFLRVIPRWTSLKSLGTSAVIKSSYYWFILVPIFARLLEKVESPLDAEILGAQLRLSLELPFSWKMFFFAACCFSLASLIFRLRCPPPIQKYTSFEDYQAQGKHTDALIRGMWAVSVNRVWSWPLSPRKERFFRFLRDFTDLPSDEIEKSKRKSTLLISVVNADIPANKLKGAYYFVEGEYDRGRPITRLVCTLLYVFGFLLIAAIIFQNIVYVVLH